MSAVVAGPDVPGLMTISHQVDEGQCGVCRKRLPTWLRYTGVHRDCLTADHPYAGGARGRCRCDGCGRLQPAGRLTAEQRFCAACQACIRIGCRAGDDGRCVRCGDELFEDGAP